MTFKKVLFRLLSGLVLFCSALSFAQTQPRLEFKNEKASVTFTLETLMQGVYGNNAFWGLAQTYAPTAHYPQNFYWGEGYIKPGIKGTLNVTEQFSLYGGTALIASGTLGDDYFLYGTAGTVQISEAYLGLRFSAGKFTLNVSVGKQPFSIASGFIIYNGGANGFERGALLLAPYRAWKQTALLTLKYANFSLGGFYIENDAAVNQKSDQITGATFEWKLSPSIYAGIAYLYVIKSENPYPTLTPGVFIENGRQGLNVFDLYWKYETFEGILAGFSFKGEAVLQFKSEINMLAYGTGIEAGYRFLKLAFTPRISYMLSYTSGAEQNNSLYTRFDGLFWEGSPSAWSAGGNASMSFMNSNLFFQRIKIEGNFSAKDIVSISYYYIMAAQLQSPLQFGQTTRYNYTIGKLVLGSASYPLASDIYIEYTHIFTDYLFLTGGLAISIPDKGLQDIINESGVWTGGFISLLLKL